MDARDCPPPRDRDRAWRWFDEFLCRPHGQIGRDGHVCPFVGPAIGAGTLRVEEWETEPEPDVDALAELVRRMVDTFEHAEWAARNRTLHALVVVLKGLDRTALSLLDETHEHVKSELVGRHLMLGQFHPDCDERAVRNPGMHVSRAPVPLFALRHMAFHDVLFLDEDPEWFGAYHARFGHRYASNSASASATATALPDPLFAERYQRACGRWAAWVERSGA